MQFYSPHRKSMLFVIVAIFFYTNSISQKQYDCLDWKTNVTVNTFLVQKMHQGAWVTTQTGEDWFLHFQDKGVYGRVVRLEPLNWMNNWPVIGIDKNGDGTGEPVSTYKNPNVGKKFAITTPVESDEFDSNALDLQWQWMANPQPYWYFMHPAKGVLRLFSAKEPDNAHNLWEVPSVLLQKFPADEFMITTKLSFYPNQKLENEETGLAIMVSVMLR